MSGYLGVPGLPTPPPADRVNCLLDMVVGASTGNCPGVPIIPQIVSPIIEGIFNIIDVSAISVAGILSGYWIMSQTMTTAHTGSDSLKKVGMLWMPIRIIFVSLMLVPISSNALSFGQQLIILNGAKIGIAVADWAQNKVVDPILKSQTFKLLPPPPPDVTGLEGNLLASLTCEKILNAANGTKVVRHILEQTGSNSQGSTDYSMLRFEAFGNSPYKGDPCGAFIIPNASAYTPDQTSDPGSSWIHPISTQAGQVIQAAQVGALQQMLQNLQPIAQAITSNIVNPQGTPGSGQRAKCFENQDQPCLNKSTTFPTPSYQSKDPAGGGFVGNLVGVGQKYEQSVMNAAQSGGNVGLYENSQYGFFGAGEIFQRLALHERAVISAAHNIPSPAKEPIDTSLDPAIKEGLSEVIDYIQNYGYSGQNQNGGTLISNLNPGSTQACTSEKGLAFPDNIPCKITQTLAASRSGTDPIVGFINLGTMLEDAAGISLFAGVVGGLADSSIGNAGTMVAEWVGIPGTLMAEVVPLIPSILWIFFIVSYLALVMQAMAAAPLWFLAHLDPSQEGIAGAYGTTGYKLLLAIIFRPVLGILGLFVGIMLGEVGLMLTYDLMVETIGMIGHGSTGHEIFSTIADLLIFGVTAVVVMFKSMELILYLPETVMRWLGGPMDSMGETGAMGKVMHYALEKGKEGFRGATKIGGQSKLKI